MSRRKSARLRLLTAQRLREVLNYEPSTGTFTWRVVTSNRVKIGAIAGEVDRHGHRNISVDGARYGAHRLAWLYMCGRWPEQEIDHINLRKDDNRIKNLREATRNENCRNVTARRNNKSGFKGVCKLKNGPYYVAQIVIGGKTKYLGCFPTPEKAHDAYVSASRVHHGEFGRIA